MVGDVVVRAEQYHPLLPQLAAQLVEVDEVVKGVAHPRLVRVVPPGGRVQEHSPALGHAEQRAQLGAPALGGVGGRKRELVVSGVALLDHHLTTTLLGQAEGVREVTRAVGRGREQVGPLPGVHAKAVGELAGGVERVGGLYLDVVAQALEGRAVPALHEDLPLLGRHVLGKARVEHEHLGRGEGAEVVLGPPLHHARSLVGEKGLAPCALGALGTLEAPHEAVVGKALLLEHLQVDGPRGAREGPPAEGLEEHGALVDGGRRGQAVVLAPLV